MPRKFQFDEFTLDESRYCLRRGERVLRLEKRPMELLLLLVERRGELVSRDEIAEKLWGKDVFVDVDHSINTAVRKVRQVLRDDPEKPRYVETVVGKGYRFAAAVICSNGASSSQFEGKEVSSPAPPAPDHIAETEPRGAAVALETPAEVTRTNRKVRFGRWLWLVAGAIGLAFVIALVTSWVPPSTAVVEQITQLTEDGKAKNDPLFTDGERIYFNQGEPPDASIGQVAIAGGPVAKIPTPTNARLAGMAPRGSGLLLLDSSVPYGIPFGPGALWQLPLPAGSPRRLNDIRAIDANYTPDGRILYCEKNSLFLAENDGTNSRKLVDNMPGFIIHPRMSPDGSHIVFMVVASDTPSQTPPAIKMPAVFVGNFDGTGVHLLAESKPDGWIWEAIWTADSKYLLVTKVHHRSADIWLFPQQTGFLASNQKPIQLTNGPIAYGAAAATPDGKQILAIGLKQKGEAVRYDFATSQFVPLLPGVPVFDPTFSREGQWVAYTSYPNDTLWRSRSDGSEALQLTYPPDAVIYPFISPDGKQVAYQTMDSDGAYVISMEGGAPRKVVNFACSPTTWSPDSKKLIFNDYRNGVEHATINVLDLTTGQISVLPGNQLGPMFIGPDKLIAGRHDLMGFQTFDFATQQWTDVPNPVQGQVYGWDRSPDFQYFYYGSGDKGEKLIRLRTADFKAEIINLPKNFPRAHFPDGTCVISVAPDGSPVLTRELGTQEIYALTVKWP